MPGSARPPSYSVVMARPDRIRLVVLFGGRSAEHEVSCISALHVLQAVDPDRYDVVPIGITREGRWVESSATVAALGAGASALPSPDDSDGPELDPLPAISPTAAEVVVLPLLHGPMGEDGTVQGLLELAGVPYVGAGVLGSALCMDKAAAKDVLAAHGLPQARWLSARDSAIDDAFADRVEAELGFPGVREAVQPRLVGGRDEGARPRRAAPRSTRRCATTSTSSSRRPITGREIEVAVLGNAQPRASVPGEIVPSHDFYDFEDKYLDGTAGLIVPAPLDDEATAEVQELALRAYAALRVDGMARVDFFYEEGGRGFLVNELNTIPGFTPISMYPKLWEASGLPYADLIDELVRLAIERRDRRARFETKRWKKAVRLRLEGGVKGRPEGARRPSRRRTSSRRVGSPPRARCASTSVAMPITAQ